MPSVMENSPSINIKEKKALYLVEMNTPGLKKDEFNIYLEGKTLVISYPKISSWKMHEQSVALKNKNGSGLYLLRFLSLPDDVDSDRVTAKYNGVLRLRIPKKHNVTQKKVKK